MAVEAFPEAAAASPGALAVAEQAGTPCGVAVNPVCWVSLQVCMATKGDPRNETNPNGWVVCCVGTIGNCVCVNPDGAVYSCTDCKCPQSESSLAPETDPSGGGGAVIELEGAGCTNYGIVVQVGLLGHNTYYCGDPKNPCENEGVIVFVGQTNSCLGHGSAAVCYGSTCVWAPDRPLGPM